MVIRVYDAHNDFEVLKRVTAFSHVYWSILDTDFSPEGKFVIYCGWSPYLYLFNVIDDEVTRETHIPLDLK
jgi:WD repeat-containing protein 23